MKHSAFRQVFYQRLTKHYKQGELQALYHWCVAELEGWTRAQAYLHDDEDWDDARIARWEKVIARLQQQEPIQYIFGKTAFFGLELHVDDRVLIPRPETEELVEWVLESEGLEEEQILDIGTGSGCIALALKSQRPQWQVRGCDVSEDALSVASGNAAQLHLPVEFVKADVLEDGAIFHWGTVWVSNPPYIPEGRKAEMEDRVLQHEPHLALFEAHPLQFFEAILKRAMDAGIRKVYFETHAQEKQALEELVQSIAGGKARTAFKNDLAGKPRFLMVDFSSE
jgi:release factor glutamine methyltransferase